MAYAVLNSIRFQKLKGLENVEIKLSRGLTAIMGVNGVGKTTVIHALACVYQPANKGEYHKFPEFFVPNTDNLWGGSEFSIDYVYQNKSNEKPTNGTRSYSKVARWKPQLGKRPKRDVYYIGINSCLPVIEQSDIPWSRVSYASSLRNDELSRQVLEYASEILDMEYEQLYDNSFRRNSFYGVERKDGLKYSSLSMGTGEQRVIRILEKVLAADDFSLILIDELDLLLHVSAVRRLVEVLDKLARKKKLQIVFTTHSLEIPRIQCVSVQYLFKQKYCSNAALYVYDHINYDLLDELTGCVAEPLHIFVEDRYAASVVRKVARDKSMSKQVKVIIYGSIENACIIASSAILCNKDFTNGLILLDGDKYVTRDEKLAHINKKLTGTEEDSNARREHALDLLNQFDLPAGNQPEQFLHHLFVECVQDDSELARVARSIKHVENEHDWIDSMCEYINDSKDNIVREMIDVVKDTEVWKSYIAPLDTWLEEHKDIIYS